MVESDMDCSGEVADTDHAHEGVFHARILCRSHPRQTLQICCVYREMQCCNARPAPNALYGVSVRPEAERLGCDAYFDEERAECGCETNHGRDEQDGHGSRQVDGDERGCEQRHHHQ